MSNLLEVFVGVVSITEVAEIVRLAQVTQKLILVHVALTAELALRMTSI
jgi:hypothetical protein